MAPVSLPLSRSAFAQVLGLPENAVEEDLRRAASRLLTVLHARAARIDARSDLSPEERDERAALAQEIEGVEAAIAEWAPGRVAAEVASATDRNRLAGVLLAAAFLLALMIAYAGGLRVSRTETEGSAARFEEPAILLMTGRLPGATLRILDADREELLVKTEAEGARVELASGRYALEVTREDCPDPWTRSHFFEAGATHRFEPRLCLGDGQLTIRSEENLDRLRIDGFDVDAAQTTPHTLEVGDHRIRADKTGQPPFEARIRMTPDAKMDLRVDFAAKGEKRKGAGQKAPAGLKAPPFKPSAPVKAVPFDLGQLKKDLAPQNLREESSQILARETLPGRPNGGSTTWHDRISRDLVSRFDSDQSGTIDRVAESEAIPCSLWKEIESDFNRGRLGLSLARYYGFDGSEWHPKALGFDRATRSVAYAKMKECGLSN